MRVWIRIALSILVICALLYSCVFLYLSAYGKSILIKYAQEATGKRITIASFYLRYPFNIVAVNTNIPGIVNIERLYISPSIVGFLTGRIAFNEIRVIRPEVTIEIAAQEESANADIRQDQIAAEPISPAAPLNSPVTGSRVGYKQLPGIILRRIVIEQGVVNLLDHKVSTEGIKITFKDVTLVLTNFYTVARPAIANFMLKARIPWQEGRQDGKIELEGWINLFKKDMLASLKIEGIDGVYLYPYYSTWVDLEKARIESAKLNFTSNLSSLNNDLTAECHLELADIVRRPRESNEPQEKAERLTDAVLDIFRAMNQGKIVLNFTIRTKMDRPEFGFGDIKMAFENKLAQSRRGGFGIDSVLKLPVNLLQGTFKSAGELTRAVFEGVITVGKEAKKAADGAFSKDK